MAGLGVTKSRPGSCPSCAGAQQTIGIHNGDADSFPGLTPTDGRARHDRPYHLLPADRIALTGPGNRLWLTFPQDGLAASGAASGPKPRSAPMARRSAAVARRESLARSACRHYAAARLEASHRVAVTARPWISTAGSLAAG
jgi:hypothetical protein